MKLLALIILATSLAFGLSAASADVISERKANFRTNAASLKAINKAIPDGDFAAIALAAETVAEWSRNMTAFFPEDSAQGDTKARPEIWMEWEKFETYAKSTEENALALAALAKAGNQDALPGALGALGAKLQNLP